jgi:hypothetical protein
MLITLKGTMSPHLYMKSVGLHTDGFSHTDVTRMSNNSSK